MGVHQGPETHGGPRHMRNKDRETADPCGLGDPSRFAGGGALSEL